MGRNTSIALGNHLEDFIADQVNSGKYSSASEVVRAGLRLLEDHEVKLSRLRVELQKGESGGTVTSDEYASAFKQRREQYLQQLESSS